MEPTDLITELMMLRGLGVLEPLYERHSLFFHVVLLLLPQLLLGFNLLELFLHFQLDSSKGLNHEACELRCKHRLKLESVSTR